MSNKDTPICAFNSNECNGKIIKVGSKISIPETHWIDFMWNVALYVSL